MTSDDSRQNTSQTDEMGQGGLPDDAGNDMAERSGYTRDSGSGSTDTPIATGSPMAGSGSPGSGAVTDTGTTFGTGGDDKGM